LSILQQIELQRPSQNPPTYVPINPNDEASIKLKHNALVTVDSDPEAIILHEVQFNRLQITLSLAEAAPRKAVYEATLGPELLIKWRDACVQPPVNCNDFAALTLAEFNEGREQFVLKFMDRAISSNTRSWLYNQAKKPKSMFISDFTSRISQICTYFTFNGIGNIRKEPGIEDVC